ncbi:MAG: hypothetical protein EAZ62_05960 [Sphingobacteriia bacterium]|nr:MAG: hypothetical protein EAZ62_05960 [Sphingobacteriia bacterium]
MAMLGLSLFVVGQNWALEQYRPSDGKKQVIKVGDKVLISFDQRSTEASNRPSDIFINSTDTTTTQINLKARITGITPTTILFKDRTEQGQREMRIDKITGLRRLALGKQILRATGQGLGYLSLGFAVAYVNQNLWSALVYLVGGFSLIAVTTDEFAPKYKTDWRIRVVPMDSKTN